MERSAPEIEAFAQHMRDEVRASRVAMVRRGISRGELPPRADVELMVDLLSAPVQLKLLFNERLDSATVDRMLDLVLAGGGADAATRKPTAKRPRKAAGNVRVTATRAARPVPVTSRSAAAARRAKKR